VDALADVLSAARRRPGRYLSRLRADRAAQLLRDTDEPILHIATEVGYASEQALSKAFTCQYATAPGRYRRQAGS
jgi:AraC family transcriptional regulator